MCALVLSINQYAKEIKMKNLYKIIYITVASFSLSALMQAKAQNITIAGWTFDNDGIAVINSPAPSTNNSTGTVSADSIGMATYATPNVGVTTDDVLAGKNSDTGVNGVADTTNTWRVRAQAGSNGAANGWSSLAPIGTQGAQFFVPTTSYTSSSYSGIKISFDWYATTQGEANLQLEYTTNGGSTWQNVALTLGGSDAGLQVLNNSSDSNTVTGSYVSDNLLNNSKAGQDWFTGLTATINDPNALNDPGFGIEMVNASTGTDDVSTQGTALNNNSGNWRFDNVSVVAVAPEPSTYALMLGGFALLVFYQRSRKGHSQNR
jgi:hypothetical protein